MREMYQGGGGSFLANSRALQVFSARHQKPAVILERLKFFEDDQGFSNSKWTPVRWLGRKLSIRSAGFTIRRDCLTRLPMDLRS